MGLLSDLNPCPLSLVLHFFAVAIYEVGRLLLLFPSFKRMWIGARLILCASGIIFPIVKAEGVRQMFFPTTLPAFYRSPLIRLSLNWIKIILTVGPKEWRTNPRNGQIMSFISKE